MNARSRTLAVLVVLVLLIGCLQPTVVTPGPGVTVTPMSEPSSSSTRATTATETSTPTPTETLTATPTPTATSTSTATPTWHFITPTPEGTIRPTSTPMGTRAGAVRLMSVSVYVPRAGGINGRYGPMASGLHVRRGAAACGPAWPFGTVFMLPAWVTDYELPRVVVCLDRGGLVGNGHVDVALTGDVLQDLETARAWGRRVVTVEVNP